MNPCGRKVVVVFGCLILLAVLFVPSKETKVDVYQSGSSLLARRVTTVSNGHMFLPQFLKNRGHWVSRETGGRRHLALNTKLFLGEIAVLLFLAVFDYLVFCVWVRRKRIASND